MRFAAGHELTSNRAIGGGPARAPDAVRRSLRGPRRPSDPCGRVAALVTVDQVRAVARDLPRS